MEEDGDAEIAEEASAIVHTRAPTAPDVAGAPADAPVIREDVQEARRGFFARLSRGTRRAFRTAGRVFRSVASAVRRGAARLAVAVDLLLTPIRDAIVLALEQIGRVRQLLYDALRSWRIFLFGHPMTVGHPEQGYISVQFGGDRDARIVHLNDPAAEVSAAFRLKAERVFRLMSLTLRAGAFVLTSVRLLATWRGRIRLVIALLGLLRRSIRARLASRAEAQFEAHALSA